MRFRFLTFLCSTTVLLSTCSSFGWGDWGHMTVADIAYSRLNIHAKQEVDRLLKINVPPFTKNYRGRAIAIDPANTATFVTSACWADDIKSNSDRHWHYIDIPYIKDDISVPGGSGSGSDILQQLDICAKTLRKQNAAVVEKAKRLRYLIHLVGDVHQPLHCAELVSKKHPKGDGGGNDFDITGSEDNLHSLWDHAVGFFPSSRPKRPLSDLNKAKVQSLAATCTQENPEASMGNEPRNLKFQEWVEDTHELAVQHAYKIKEGSEPSSSYVQDGQKVARAQVALAGYRLAHLLNDIWK